MKVSFSSPVCFLLIAAAASLLSCEGPSLSLSLMSRKERLFWAIEFNKVDEVRSLLGKRPDLVNASDGVATPLLAAVTYRRAEIAKLLLEKGADPNLQGLEQGFTPLFAAVPIGEVDAALGASWDPYDMVKILLDSGADVHARFMWGTSILHTVVKAAPTSTRTIELLIERGAEVDARNDIGATPLSWAASGGRVEAVRFLLEKGTDPTVKDRDGATIREQLERGPRSANTDQILELLGQYEERRKPDNPEALADERGSR